MYGPSDFDTRHVLVINYVWDIGFANHMSNLFGRTLLGNWQFSGTIQGQSGRPQTVSQNNDRAGVGPGSGNQFWVVSAIRSFPTSSPVARTPTSGLRPEASGLPAARRNIRSSRYAWPDLRPRLPELLCCTAEGLPHHPQPREPSADLQGRGIQLRQPPEPRQPRHGTRPAAPSVGSTARATPTHRNASSSSASATPSRLY